MRWSIIGVGRAGKARIAALRVLGEEIVAAYRGRFIAELKVPEVDTIDEAIARADVVVVCSPTPYHAQHVRQALDAGRHVVVEYPLATSAAEASALYDLAKQRGVVLHVEHIERLAPATTFLKQIVHDEGWHSSLCESTHPVAFETPEAHALSLLPKLHRIEEIFGTIQRVVSIEATIEEMRIVIFLESGDKTMLRSLYAPKQPRTNAIHVVTLKGRAWTLKNRELYVDTEPVELPVVGLFLLDTEYMIRRVMGKQLVDSSIPAAVLRILNWVDDIPKQVHRPFLERKRAARA